MAIKDLSSSAVVGSSSDNPAFTNHMASTSNPHGVTVGQIGAIAASSRAIANGVASLDSSGFVPDAQLSSTIARSSALTAHTGSTNNPHSVTASQVGNTTAQWNANQIQGRNISNNTPTTGQALVWNGSLWLPQTLTSSPDADLTAIGGVGRWFIFRNIPSVTTSALGTNTIFFTLMSLKRAVTVDALGINVSASGVNANVYGGIYSNANGEPGTRLVDAGSVSATTTGTKTLAFTALALPAGVYWIAIASDVSSTLTATLVSFANMDTLGNASISTTGGSTGKTTSWTPGAMPTSAPVTSFTNTSPVVWVRTV